MIKQLNYKLLGCGTLLFLVTTGFFLARTAKDALFYSTAGPQLLPLAFILNAFTIFFLVGWIDRILAKVTLKQRLYLAWFATFLCALAFGVLFFMGGKREFGLIPYFLFFTFFEIPYLILTGLFWTFAEQYFTEREADSAFPKITSGAHLGTVLAGVIAIFASPYIGAGGLILVWAVTLVVGLALIYWMWLKQPPKYTPVIDTTVDDAPHETPERFAGVSAVLRYRYAVLFMVITFCTFFVMSVFDYSLADTFSKDYGNDTGKLTIYIGWITALFGIVAFIMQLGLVPRLLKKLGVANTNMVAPALLTIGSGVLLTTYSFGAAGIARGLFLVNEFVFNQTLLPFIYGAVPERDRSKVRSMIEGTVTNAALAFAGLFLILPNMVKFQNHWLGMAAFVVSLLMFGLSWLLRSEYFSIVGIRYEAKDVVGRMKQLETLLDTNQQQLGMELNRDLISDSEPSVLLALNFVSKHKQYQSLKSVISLADSVSISIRLNALKTLESIIRTNADFDSFKNTILWPAADPLSGCRRFRKEDIATLEAIGKIYREAGQASQLGYDFQYLIEDKKFSPLVRALAAKLVIKESGAIAPIQAALALLEEAACSEQEDDMLMAAEIIGDLGFDKAMFSKISEWLAGDASSVNNMQRHNSDVLRVAALDAVTKVGVSSRTASEDSLIISLRYLSDPLLSDTAISGARKIITAHPELTQIVGERWRDNKQISGLRESMLGDSIKLPLLLLHDHSIFAEKLLLEFIDSAEQQIARVAFRVLESLVLSSGNMSTVGREFCLLHKEIIIERICLCGALSVKGGDAFIRPELAHDSLMYRLQELFRQYSRTVWLACRIPQNASRFDNDIREIHSEDILVRDRAIKSIENSLESKRELFLEISDLTDSLDYRQSDEVKAQALLSLAKKRNYPWLNDSPEDLFARLIELRQDIWLDWALQAQNSKNSPQVDEDFEQYLMIVQKAKPFTNVPAELLANLVLNAKRQNWRKDERLFFEGRENQGLFIILKGETCSVIGSLVMEKYPSPMVFGQYSAIAGYKSPFGCRANSETVEGLWISQPDLDSWRASHSNASRQICKSMIGEIERLNEREQRIKEENKGMHEVLEQLKRLEDKLSQAVPSIDTKNEKKVRRYLAAPNNADISCIKDVSASFFEQYYLIVDNKQELRIRRENSTVCTMTLKNQDRGEVTISVDISLFDELISHRVGRVIQKKRYTFTTVPYLSWTVDVYEKESSFRGMVIAELTNHPEDIDESECPSEFNVQHEITGLPEFDNRNLALHGLPDLAHFC